MGNEHIPYFNGIFEDYFPFVRWDMPVPWRLSLTKSDLLYWNASLLIIQKWGSGSYVSDVLGWHCWWLQDMKDPK